MATFLTSLTVSAVLTGLAIPMLRRAQFMDVPNHRSSHTRPVPRGGGLAVVLATCVVALFAADLDAQLAALLTITLLLGAVGLVDDLRSLPSALRLVAQLLAGLGLAAALLADGVVAWWWLPILVVAIAGYVNAYNFMDGINGISALTALVVGAHWTWVGAGGEHQGLHVLGLVLAGAALGFLPWNAPRALVFLGDVGSYGIGVFIVALSAWALADGLPWQWSLAPLVIYGADTGWVLVKRYRGGRSLTEAHREHVYQRLVDSGWSHIASAALCALAGAVVCALTLVSGKDVAWWLPAAVVMVLLAYLSAPRLREAPSAMN